MYPIDNKFSAIMWAQTIAKAHAGDQQEQEMLQVENQIRAEINQPTVEQEIEELMKKTNNKLTQNQRIQAQVNAVKALRAKKAKEGEPTLTDKQQPTTKMEAQNNTKTSQTVKLPTSPNSIPLTPLELQSLKQWAEEASATMEAAFSIHKNNSPGLQK